MRQINVRVDEAFYNEAKAKADELGVSLSDLVRDAVKQVYSNGTAPHTAPNEIPFREMLDILRGELDGLREELFTKNNQISELHQLLAMSQKNTGELTQQLEDMRQTRRWWHWWKRAADSD
jgi:antitoxin component of RelBE/YafQ-DinJ toxin-antitoxin module